LALETGMGSTGFTGPATIRALLAKGDPNWPPGARGKVIRSWKVLDALEDGRFLGIVRGGGPRPLAKIG